jgi:hypothetical protein
MSEQTHREYCLKKMAEHAVFCAKSVNEIIFDQEEK